MAHLPLRLVAAALLAAVLLSTNGATAQPGSAPQLAPADTGFTYQGRLAGASGPLTAGCAFQFRLYDAAAGGAQVGSTQVLNAVAVQDGLFTVTLNGANEFGASAFDGTARWLEVAVKCPSDPTFTTLAPRQALTPAPYALYAASATNARSAPWSGLTGVPTGFADNA